jgi:ubiquinone/menaquinone biosynthesis C-methylase UbiE
MSIRDAYTAWSPTYDTQENPTRDLDARVTRELLGERRRANILELGCGTGKNTAFLARIGERVQALDFSEGMLALAREKVRTANVTFTVADLTQSWPVPNRSIDLIVCNLVLEHIEELSPIFAEAVRCLVPGGEMFVSELHPFRQYQGTVATIAGDGTLTRIDAFIHHISDFLAAARAHGLTLRRLDEWWREPDRARPPLLLTLLFAA